MQHSFSLNDIWTKAELRLALVHYEMNLNDYEIFRGECKGLINILFCFPGGKKHRKSMTKIKFHYTYGMFENYFPLD